MIEPENKSKIALDIQKLPFDTINFISSFLDFESLSQLAKTTQFFRKVTRKEIIRKLQLLSQSVEIITGRDSCFFLIEGRVLACGKNEHGQLGFGNKKDSSKPKRIFNLTGVKDIAAGDSHTVFLMDDGTVRACGLRGCQLGSDECFEDRLKSEPILGLAGVKDIAAGNSHTIFLMDDGTVQACGHNLSNQLGDDEGSRAVPEKIPGLQGVKAIAAGWDHSLFLKEDGTVWACGGNLLGQLGPVGVQESLKQPTQIVGLSDVKKIVTSQGSSIFLKEDGTVWSCGCNYENQLGQTEQEFHVPTQIPGLTEIVDVSLSASHSLFLKKDGTVLGCGGNNYGQLGASSDKKVIPEQILDLSDITAIATGFLYSIFRKKDGTMLLYGDNSFGQLGLKNKKSYGESSHFRMATELCFERPKALLEKLQKEEEASKELLEPQNSNTSYCPQ